MECWPEQWELTGILTNIIFLKLFHVVFALNIWGYCLRTKKIIFNVDNQAVFLYYKQTNHLGRQKL